MRLTALAALLQNPPRRLIDSDIPTSPQEHRMSETVLSPDEILRQLRSLRHGTLEIQVHDARIVQVERRERQRFESRSAR